MKLQFGNQADSVYKQWKRRDDSFYETLKNSIVATASDPFSSKEHPVDSENHFYNSFGPGLFYVYSVSDETVRIEAIFGQWPS